MKPRHAAVLALVALSVLATGCWTSEPAPPNTAPQIKKAKVQAVIDTDPNIQRIRKLEHVTKVSAAEKGCDVTGCRYAILVQVNSPRDLATVQSQVQSYIGGYPANIGGYPVEFDVLHGPREGERLPPQ
jgi:hypothetical protein